MSNILKNAFWAIALLLAHPVLAQTDADNLANARSALSLNHNCEDAIHYLNQVSPDNRQTADYYLCMARTQDCKNNNEQAIYYYNKYLGLKPGTDSVVKRVAELKDMSNQKARVNNEVVVAKNTYQTASKNKKRRHYLLDDNFYTSGMGYGKGLSGANSPYGSAFILNGGSGFMLMHNKAVLDFNTSTCFLTSPNDAWVNNALQAPAGTGGGMGTGFAEIITLGFSPVLINQKKLALTAGVMAGVNIYLLNVNIDYTGSNSIDDKFSFCYGIKSNLYLGEHVMFFAHLILNAANTANVTNDIANYTVPANYNMFQLGISYKFDSWW